MFWRKCFSILISPASSLCYWLQSWWHKADFIQSPFPFPFLDFLPLSIPQHAHCNRNQPLVIFISPSIIRQSDFPATSGQTSMLIWRLHRRQSLAIGLLSSLATLSFVRSGRKTLAEVITHRLIVNKSLSLSSKL